MCLIRLERSPVYILCTHICGEAHGGYPVFNMQTADGVTEHKTAAFMGRVFTIFDDGQERDGGWI
jgi:hypothetical protein